MNNRLSFLLFLFILFDVVDALFLYLSFVCLWVLLSFVVVVVTGVDFCIALSFGIGGAWLLISVYFCILLLPLVSDLNCLTLFFSSGG